VLSGAGGGGFGQPGVSGSDHLGGVSCWNSTRTNKRSSDKSPHRRSGLVERSCGVQRICAGIGQSTPTFGSNCCHRNRTCTHVNTAILRRDTSQAPTFGKVVRYKLVSAALATKLHVWDDIQRQKLHLLADHAERTIGADEVSTRKVVNSLPSPYLHRAWMRALSTRVLVHSGHSGDSSAHESAEIRRLLDRSITD
jgi:hypothetical protein